MTQKLPDEIVWDEGGHLSEIALTSIADGQEAILPEAAGAHFASCSVCMQSMGNAALLSTRVAGLLAEGASAAQATAEAPVFPIPVSAIAAAVLLAAVGALPSITDLPMWISEASFLFTRTIPLFFRSGIALVRSSGSLSPAVSYACAALLLMAGFAITRAVPRSLPSGAQS
ncbi:MAG: hypothetical protein ABIP39_08055 [Polyangiaceae bacterium]